MDDKYGSVLRSVCATYFRVQGLTYLTVSFNFDFLYTSGTGADKARYLCMRFH